MSDRRYGSLRWKRLRLAVLNRDQYECQIRGPRCRQFARTVHHIHPISQGGAFFDETNLQSACGNCNFSHGAYMTRDSRRAIIERNEHLERIVKVQEARIEELAQALHRERNGSTAKPARPRAKPAIH